METQATSTIANEKVNSQQALPTAQEIQAHLVDYLAELLEIKPNEFDVQTTFDRYGLDSAAVVGMTGDLETWLGRKIPPNIAYEHPTVESLAQHLAAQ